MQTTTVLLIILAAVVALAIVLFQYYFKSKTKGKLGLMLSFLRFLALFGVLLLLVNPKFIKREYILEKSNLIFLVDNSSSIKQHNAHLSVDSLQAALKNSGNLSNRFNIADYQFDSALNTNDSLTFDGNNTDVSKALQSLNAIFGNGDGAIVLLTDGNGTIGEDYEYYGKNQKFPVYPLVLGDTTSYEDVRIDQVNANKYAFLKNKFPVETFISYEGKSNIKARFSLSLDGKLVYSQNVDLSPSSGSRTITTNLDANSVGLKTLEIVIQPLDNEKNIFNNTKKLSIEVIDEKTNIALISDILHPDLGALKQAIESNGQRSVTIHKSSVANTVLQDVDLFILYQPTAAFRNIYDYIEKSKANIFTVTGPKTDWEYLNGIQNSFTKNSFDQTEEAVPLLNQGFSIFDGSEFLVDDYPPLETTLGEVIINRYHDVLLGQKIKGVEINEPLLALMGNDKEREAIVFGENIWKWRIQSFREHQNFANFDEIIGKIMLYLSTDRSRSRLELDYKSFYEGNGQAKIVASYFDETFSFDPNANISLVLQKQGDLETIELPMLLRGGYYEADLGNMPFGAYGFEVKVADGMLTKSGNFNILDFDVEQQFLSSNYKKLNRLAEQTNGALYYPAEIAELEQDIMANDNFKPKRKSHENVVSLVDFKVLLGIVIVAFSAEWFIRKFNGLI